MRIGTKSGDNLDSVPAQPLGAGALAYPYRGSRRAHAALSQAASVADGLGMELAVVVPLVLPSDGGRRCCGIQGPKWEQLLREAMDEEAEGARRVLREARVRHSVTVAEGDSVPRIVATFAAAGGRELALPNTASGPLFTRRTLRTTERLAECAVRRLPAP